MHSNIHKLVWDRTTSCRTRTLAFSNIIGYAYFRFLFVANCSLVVFVIIPSISESYTGMTLHYIIAVYLGLNVIFNFIQMLRQTSFATGDQLKNTLDRAKGPLKINKISSTSECMDEKPETTWCTTCKISKKRKTHHCLLCNVCIERRDHHCFFIGECIGQANQQYFIAYTLHQVLAGLYFAVIVIFYISNKFKFTYTPYKFCLLPFIIMYRLAVSPFSISLWFCFCNVLMYSTLLAATAALCFFIWQCSIVSRGLTSHEAQAKDKVTPEFGTLNERVCAVFKVGGILSLLIPFRLTKRLKCH